MLTIHLATALVIHDDSVLLVASNYPNHARPLWNMPGGRQRPPELLCETAIRELYEETAMRGIVEELAYISESYDGETHFINATFLVQALGEPRIPNELADHVAGAAWVPKARVAERIQAAVVREPLLQYLAGGFPRRYAGYAEAGISIVFPLEDH